MKYILVLVVVIVLARIDYVFRLFDIVSEKVQEVASPKQEPVKVESRDDLISIIDDKALKSNDKEGLVSLMNEFHLKPSDQIRQDILQFIESHPKLFKNGDNFNLGPILFGFRDLVVRKDSEFPKLLTGLMAITDGQNLESVKKVFSLYMDDDVEKFITYYSQTKDLNCLIATTLGDPVPEEGLFLFFQERERVFNEFIGKEKVDPQHRAFAQNCLLVLKLYLTKLSPPPENSENSENSESEEASAP